MEFDLNLTIRILTSIGFGFMLGLEREVTGKFGS